MTHTQFIRKSFEIKDPNISFTKEVNEQKIKGIKHVICYGKLTYPPKGCVKYGVINQSHADIVKNGTKEVTIKVTQTSYKPVLLKLKKQRFYSKHCCSTFIPETKLVDRHCSISNVIKRAIALELQPMKLIAKRLNVSSHTVLRVLNQVGETMKPNYNYLPEHLSMDEFKSVKQVSGAMSLIFIDAQRHEVMDIVENRQQSYLIFYALLLESQTPSQNSHYGHVFTLFPRD